MHQAVLQQVGTIPRASESCLSNIVHLLGLHKETCFYAYLLSNGKLFLSRKTKTSHYNPTNHVCITFICFP